MHTAVRRSAGHTCGRLVQEHDGGIADKATAHAQPSQLTPGQAPDLHTPWQGAAHLQSHSWHCHSCPAYIEQHVALSAARMHDSGELTRGCRRRCVCSPTAALMHSCWSANIATPSFTSQIKGRLAAAATAALSMLFQQGCDLPCQPLMLQ